MALHWRPVGPEPAPTYWQRRAVVVVALLLVVLFLRAVLTGGGGREQVAGPAASPPASPSAVPAAATAAPGTPGPSPSPAVVPCVPPALVVTAQADRRAYPVGGRPVLVLTVTNTGAAPCSRDLGQAAVELTVVSGADRIWSSDDCRPGGPNKPVVLAPAEDQVTRLTWDGRRSTPGCKGAKAAAVAGTYRVGARVGDLRVEGGAFRLE